MAVKKGDEIYIFLTSTMKKNADKDVSDNGNTLACYCGSFCLVKVRGTVSDASLVCLIYLTNGKTET